MSRGLGGLDRCVLFDELHARVESKRLRFDIIDLNSETFEATRIGMVDSPVHRARD